MRELPLASRLRTWVAAGSAAVAALALGTAPAAAVPIVYEFTVETATGTPGPAPYGSVTLNQAGANVDVTVHLYSPYSYVKTGAGDYQAFKFNAVDVVLGDITVDSHVPVLAAATGTFNGDGGGTFAFGINCPTCGNGSNSSTFSNDIVFHVANATIADLSHPNNLGYVFAADILGNGVTGLVEAVGTTTGCIPSPANQFCTGDFVQTPEPASLALLGVGLLGLGTIVTRRRSAWLRRRV